MGASPPSPLVGWVLALAATPLMRAKDSGSAAGRPLPARKGWAVVSPVVRARDLGSAAGRLRAGPLGWGGGCCRRAKRLLSPAHGGRRATGCAREAVKANAMLYAFARTERRTWMGYTGVPAGAPCEARGSAACGTAALFWVLFWCQKSTAAQALRNRAIWRVLIFRRWNLRGQAAIKRCVPFLAQRSVAKDPLAF